MRPFLGKVSIEKSMMSLTLSVGLSELFLLRYCQTSSARHTSACQTPTSYQMSYGQAPSFILTSRMLWVELMDLTCLYARRH